MNKVRDKLWDQLWDRLLNQVWDHVVMVLNYSYWVSDGYTIDLKINA